jgi:hypothetical protein
MSENEDELIVDTRRTDVPKYWESKPEKWWSHVAGCTACRQWWRQPDQTEQERVDERSQHSL